ncbi:hypothetical protein FGIG_12369 [Fasciola gigantica]|uniref:Uncharacterized protein n=1 Tax=Fasciola gigantica TaxID=46835 RepID=A0A504YQ25_FASGI|nr:hypothetical protein FGIG_12369 [Fasciola gigantica]
MEDEQCKEASLLKFESEEADKMIGKNKVLSKKLVIYCGLLMLFSTVALVIGVTQVRIISRFSACTVHLISDILSACLVSCVTSLLSLIGLTSFCFSKRSSLKMLMISLTVVTFLLVRSFVITIFQIFEIGTTKLTEILILANGFMGGMLLLSAVLSLLIVYLIQNYEQDYIQLKNKEAFLADIDTDIVYI